MSECEDIREGTVCYVSPVILSEREKTCFFSVLLPIEFMFTRYTIVKKYMISLRKKKMKFF